MKPKLRKLLVLTSGGDAPGMNAAIRAVVRTSCYFGIEIWGARRGYHGLVNEDLIPLGPENVANIIQRGGTVLKTGRCEEFHKKAVRQRCITLLKQRAIEGMIVIGGDGSYRGASELEAEGGPACIGVPGTIDNDIEGTEFTIGFDTARNTALDAIDKIRDTASSHDRNFIVEVMGRKSGFLALDVGISGGAEYVLVPEFKMNIAELAKRIASPRRQKLSSTIVVAEGEKPGQSVQIAAELKKRTGTEYKVCILGHMQRGGSPTALDRKIASCMGSLAVNEILKGASSKMTVWKNGHAELAPFPKVKQIRRLMKDADLFHLNEILAT